MNKEQELTKENHLLRDALKTAINHWEMSIEILSDTELEAEVKCERMLLNSIKGKWFGKS